MTTESPAEQADTSPFAAAPACLRQALEKKGFETLTAVQSAVLDHLSATAGQQTDDAPPAKQNLRISSQTGSGKTVALGLALAASLLDSNPSSGGDAAAQPSPTASRRGPKALIITPTRELAAQVQGELAWLYGCAPSIDIEVVTGGTDIRREKQRLRNCPAVIVGTPGRLLDHIRSGALNLETTASVVLDEADQMLDMGFRDELDSIVTALPEDRQSHLVSATFPPAVRSLAQRFQGDAVALEGTVLGEANSNIEHIAYLIRPPQRYAALVNLLLQSHGERTLVFVRTRAETAELSEKLAGDGFSALPFSGELAQAQRTRTLNAFKSGIINTLIATDVAARGIDVPGISTVIHTDLPKETDSYTHRSGRTGRAGQQGKSLIIVPVNAQRRVQRLFQEASVDGQWLPVPSAKKIRQAVTKTTRRSLYELLADATFEDSELQYASALLEKQPPEQVVAQLLRMAETKLPREPMEVQPVDRAWSPAPTPGAGPRPPRARMENRPDSNQRYTRFEVTWGAEHGANPSRCMSHVCRRGGITRREVGAIEIDRETTIVEVMDEVAAEFEARVRKPDTRDPHVRISRATSSAQGRPGRPPRGNSRQPSPAVGGAHAHGKYRFQRPRAAADESSPGGSGPRVHRAARSRRGPPRSDEV